MAEEKSEKPTKKKIDRARKDGRTLKSPFLTQALAGFACFFGALGMVRVSWVRYLNLLEYIVTRGFNDPARALTTALQVMLEVSVAALAPMVIVLVVVTGLQQGAIWEFSIIAPKANRFGGGLKRIFGGLKDLWQKVLRSAVLGWLFYILATGRVREIVGATLLSRDGLNWYLWGLVQHWVGTGLGVLLVLGGLDYVVQRRKFYRELSMSIDEVRREHREDEGDPHIKGHRRALHMELSRQEQINRIRRAKVIVVQSAS